jgi:magnesium chelatase subunit D
MKNPIYPFSAIVGQEKMKLALLLAAVDWRISTLLRGDKGAGKTTAARGLAALLPTPAPFVNLPIGATEDRLLGGLHLERTLKGDPVLKPGLLSEAHGGVFYVDEVNLLPGHLADTLLDTASSGVNIVEREGLSASHPAEFVLLGSMNPEEGSLRPQLLDRFALVVDIAAPLDPIERQTVVERRIAFERDPSRFHSEWFEMEEQFRDQIVNARKQIVQIVCSNEILAQISQAICEQNVRSLRADLAAVRASIAYAALAGDSTVLSDHVAAVLPLVLAHRVYDRGPSRTPRLQPTEPPPAHPPSATEGKNQPKNLHGSLERVFSPKKVRTFAIETEPEETVRRGSSARANTGQRAPVVGVLRTETPAELDLRTTLNHAVLETGKIEPRLEDVHERIRSPKTGTRYLFVIDSSGSHAAQKRMSLVKGAASGLLTRSFKNGDEVAIIVFRGVSAHVILEPTHSMSDAITALEYLPTGGRTPLAHALDLAQNYLTPATILVLMTDGRANVALGSGEPWQESLEMATRLKTAALVIDTEQSTERLGRPYKLAEALGAEYTSLEGLELNADVTLVIQRLATR